MSNFPLRKSSPTKNDMKSTSQGTTVRQQGFHEVNKRRTFLQDSSWIKKRPEEEKDENYGRAVLNRHNSHDALDRKINERDEPKATLSRYRSDDTLDRSISTFKPPEATKPQPSSLLSANIATTTSSPSAITPVKKKRQSWFPPPPPGDNATHSTGASRREPATHPPIPPKPSASVYSPNQQRRDNRQICPPKLATSAETNRSAERNIRSQDLDNIVKMATSLQKTDKGEELDNLIKMNKSLNRNQGLDGLFRANPKVEQTEKRAKSLESLIFMTTPIDKDGKRNQTLDNFIKENPRTLSSDKGQDPESIVKANVGTNKISRGSKDFDNVIKVNPKGNESTTRKQDPDGLTKVNPETNKNIKRGQSLDNLIKVTSEVNRSNQGSGNLNNLIKVNPGTGKSVQWDQSLDSLIKVAPETNRTKQQGNEDLENLTRVIPSPNKSCEKTLDEPSNVSLKAAINTAGNHDLDKLIKVNPEILATNERNQYLDNLIKVNPAVIRSNQSSELDNFIKVKPSALRNTSRDQDLANVIEVNSHVSENKNGRLDGQLNGFTGAPCNQSTRTTTYSYESRNNFSSSAGTRSAGPKDTVVYTRTYVENSKSPKDGYQEIISGKYIQTVYSTSDRSVIERDMCTYCRKPLGTETKMILDELQICCHSTCFKCEICKKPLENLQAGDSIWIYRQTIHCQPCYSKVMAKWIQ
ncbi:sciellin isoform X3 [Lepus europaeus]|uniref:sciellin isoform X3 n=1 Tax=Lepus europaeus TaxID=9983 RepID=UPI002B4A4BC3|nr:sciellin isoform X3 [Lepus europaeus]